MHILSSETDNCPSWISGREKMTVENISWSISTNECCRPRRGLNPRPPGLQSDGASNWATEAATFASITCFYGKWRNYPRIIIKYPSLKFPLEKLLALWLIKTYKLIRKTCLYNFDPLKPHFYLVKLGFTGVFIIFPISVQKHRLWVLVRTASPRRF